MHSSSFQNGRGFSPAALGLNYVEWREIVLAPIFSVAAVKGLEDHEAREALRLALWHGLLTRRDENRTTTSEDAELWVKLHVASERTQLEGALRDNLERLEASDRQLLAERIWDACNDLASEFKSGHGIRIETGEKKELARIAELLGRGDDLERRAVLGAEARGLQRAGETRKIAANLPAPAVKWEGGLDPCSEWARGWDESLAERAWANINGMHAAHEALWRAGKGRLDDAQTIDTVNFDGPVYCDQGVQVFPESVLQRPLYFVGDLHGDLDSLESALIAMRFFDYTAGDTESPVAIFLGDYGDRGISTLAVWMRIAWLKRNFPQRVFLLRGNHEELLAVTCHDAASGGEFELDWHVPTTLNRESYLALGFILSGNFQDAAAIYDHLPAVALFSDGLMAVHGGMLPRWRDDDGWPADEEEKEALRVNGIADLRKPEVQLSMRWVAPRDADDLTMAWASFGRTHRIESSAADFDEFSSKTGISHMIHGHTHPPEGYDSKCHDRVIGVNTSLRVGKTAAIARYRPDLQEFEKITLPVAAPKP